MTVAGGGRRVVHVLRKYNRAEWGGIETHVAEVTRRLKDLGWSNEVHAPRGPVGGEEAFDPAVRLRRYRSFLPFLGTPARRRALVANAGNIASFEEPLRLWLDRNISLCHLHTAGRIGGGVRTAMTLSGRPYVVSVHGPQLANRQWLEADTRRRFAHTLDLGQPIGALFGARRVLDDAARVITFNDEEHDAVARRVGDRAVRMDHGVDAARLRSGDPRRARERWPFLGEAPVIAVVGRLCEQKNQTLAVRALQHGAPESHRLVLAGAATDLGYRGQVEALVRSVGLGERVHVLGNLDGDEEVPDVFAVADMVLVPSTHEAFGLAVLEGWAAGKPVLFPRHSGLQDLARAVGDEEACLPDLSEQTWAEGVRRFAESPEARGASAAAGLALVKSRFEWRIVVDRLSALYSEVLDEGGPRRVGRPRP